MHIAALSYVFNFTILKTPGNEKCSIGTVYLKLCFLLIVFAITCGGWENRNKINQRWYKGMRENVEW